MLDNTLDMSVSSTVYWSFSLKPFEKIGLKDVEVFVSVEKSLRSGLIKGYKCFGFYVFCNVFILFVPFSIKISLYPLLVTCPRMKGKSM